MKITLIITLVAVLAAVLTGCSTLDREPDPIEQAVAELIAR